MNAEALGFAALLSVPVGVGVALAVLETTAGALPGTAALAGAVAAAAVFALVVAGVAVGSSDEERAR